MPRVKILSGDRDGEIAALHGDLITIGRSPENNIQLDDVTVSRLHATFTAEAGDYVLSDLQSTSGTFVNGAQIAE